jgi:uncharacterized membrane protein
LVKKWGILLASDVQNYGLTYFRINVFSLVAKVLRVLIELVYKATRPILEPSHLRARNWCGVIDELERIDRVWMQEFHHVDILVVQVGVESAEKWKVLLSGARI